MRIYSGYTKNTTENLVLDSGAFFKNFIVGEDTFESAVEAGKLLGATRGGGEFSAVPSIRQIEVDGVKGRAKGLETIDSWDVYIKANVLEVNRSTIKDSLCASDERVEEDSSYYTIRPRNRIELDDYIENITWIGTVSGSDEPIIVQIFNVINTDGLKVSTKDKDEAVLAMTFYGHYDDGDLDTPPFAIYYPKQPEE